MKPAPAELENVIRGWDKLRSELHENARKQQDLSNREQNIRKEMKCLEDAAGNHIGRNIRRRFILLGNQIFEVCRAPGKDHSWDGPIRIEVHEVEGKP